MLKGCERFMFHYYTEDNFITHVWSWVYYHNKTKNLAIWYPWPAFDFRLYQTPSSSCSSHWKRIAKYLRTCAFHHEYNHWGYGITAVTNSPVLKETKFQTWCIHFRGVQFLKFSKLQHFFFKDRRYGILKIRVIFYSIAKAVK